MSKVCFRCSELKPLSEFSKRTNVCKPCVVLRNKEYYRTIKGMPTQMWNNCRLNSKARGHYMSFTRAELVNWLNQNNFANLHYYWEQSGYHKDLKPSIDRLNSMLPYTFDNMRLVTWKENNQAAYIERKLCKRQTKQHKPIVQYTLTGEFVAEYGTISNAARVNGFCRTNINSCVLGKNQTAHGFKWEYKRMGS